MPPDPVERIPDADLILVGGGLANGLIAWRLFQKQPELRLMLIESGDTLGGNHTWSFHEDDLTSGQKQWLTPMVVHRWNHYSVHFPGRSRQLDSAYYSITSARFNSVLQAALGSRIKTHTPVQSLTPVSVCLADGQTLTARAVIDGRGVQSSPHMSLGVQKFLGQEFRLTAPHGLKAPILMDACVPQQDGYRFVYTLPLSEDTVLIEDTFFADDEDVDLRKLRENIAAYVAVRGWKVDALLREEFGVLPLTLAGDLQAFWDATDGIPKSGLAAGLFNSATGYSLPDAVMLADHLADLPALQLHAKPLFSTIRRHALKRWNEQGFFRLLNRMLFCAALPAERWRVMQRFYGLPSPLIRRFYAARLRPYDKVRILTGKPPVAIPAAIRAAFMTTKTLADRVTP
jgi:lycopene beta-cyclase